MTTKDQERKAVEKIRKIVEELGENSYVGFAMEGVLELAEDNIREDTAYSMKKNAEIAWERADKAETENKDLKKEVEDLKNWFRRCIAWHMTRKQSQSERWRGQQIRWQRQSLPEKMCMDSQRSTRSRKQTGADTEK
jgi:hypothetical protein